MTIARQLSILIAVAVLLVVVFAVSLTRQFANLSAEGAKLIGNQERTAVLNEQLASGNSQQTDQLRRQFDTLDPSFPRTSGDLNYALGEKYAQYLKLDIDEPERLTVERIRGLQSEINIVSMHIYETLRVGHQAEAAVRLRRLYQLEGEIGDQFKELGLIQLAKLRAVVDHLNRSAARGVIEVCALVAALLLVLGAGTFAIRKRILKPVHAILDACDRVRLGDFSARAADARADEFGQLTRGFNFMAESLDESYASLEHKVEERTRQIQQMQRQLVQAEKMSAVGLLVSGVAHELNNPLASIMGAVELAKMDVSADRGTAEWITRLADIDSQVERCRRIVLNLLQFARNEEPHLEVIDINQVVDQVLELREYEMGTRNTRLVREFDPANPVLLADRDKLQQVVLNLLNNAHDAIGERSVPGTIWIRTRTDGDSVILEFLDSGPGFRNPERAFDPFYTTKEVGKGTGLGLSVCYGIVHEHRGRIVAENWENGARVTITLPVGDVTAPEAAEADSAAPVQPRLARPGPRALVVDDEESLVRLQTSFLRRMGIEAVGARSGEEAITCLEAHQVDIVISDVRMPGRVDGVMLYEWVCSHQPNLAGRFLFTSGDLVGLKLNGFFQTTGVLRLDKPFRYDAYSRVVLQALEARGVSP